MRAFTDSFDNAKWHLILINLDVLFAQGTIHKKDVRKIFGIFNPPPPFVRISRNLSLLFVPKIRQFSNPPLPPQCGRPLCMVPMRILQVVDHWDHFEVLSLLHNYIQNFSFPIYIYFNHERSEDEFRSIMFPSS